MKNIKLTTFFLYILFIVGCNSKKQKTSKDKKEVSVLYTAVDYTYPADSSVVKKWIAEDNFKAMYKHSWYVWKHITEPIGNKLRYQKWSSPKQIIHKLNDSTKNKQTEIFFEKANQFHHNKSKLITDDTDIVVTVGYNEASEKYAFDNKIFYLSSLKKMQEGNYSKIPDFPSDAINIKPVYKIITKNKLYDSIYTMPAWNGPKYYDGGYPESKWKSCIHINVKEKKSNPSGRLDYNCNDINENNIFYLNDFIHFEISKKQSDAYNAQIFGDIKGELNINSDKNISRAQKSKLDKLYQDQKSTEGDIALLVAMHVTTKEIKRWTWQTFWWSPTPLTPEIPSSNAIASSKQGIKLKGAANHYAMAVAYSMITPSQPYIGGENDGEPLIAFNPYLEAHFGQNTFTGTDSHIVNNGNKIATNLGVTTNCMSCHMTAAINKHNGNEQNGFNSPSYVGDQYISYKDSIFKNRLMLDLAWSIQGNIVLEK